MAIETPVEVLRRLREESSKRRLARAQAPAQAFTKARTGQERAGAFGQQIGTALAQAFTPEQDLEQSPEVIQARQRSKLLSIDPTDVDAMKIGIKIATDSQDYEVANYMLKNMRDQQALDLHREAITYREMIAEDRAKVKPKKPYKYESYSTDFRKQTMTQLDADDAVSGLEDVHMVAAKSAITLASEGIYNKNREGGGKMTRPEATDLALKQSKSFIIDDWGANSFNAEGYREHMINITEEPATAPPASTIDSQAEFDALPSGATYIDAADGKTYKKP